MAYLPTARDMQLAWTGCSGRPSCWITPLQPARCCCQKTWWSSLCMNSSSSRLQGKVSHSAMASAATDANAAAAAAEHHNGVLAMNGKQSGHDSDSDITDSDTAQEAAVQDQQQQQQDGTSGGVGAPASNEPLQQPHAAETEYVDDGLQLPGWGGGDDLDDGWDLDDEGEEAAAVHESEQDAADGTQDGSGDGDEEEPNDMIGFSGEQQDDDRQGKASSSKGKGHAGQGEEPALSVVKAEEQQHIAGSSSSPCHQVLKRSGSIRICSSSSSRHLSILGQLLVDTSGSKHQGSASVGTCRTRQQAQPQASPAPRWQSQGDSRVHAKRKAARSSNSRLLVAYCLGNVRGMHALLH